MIYKVRTIKKENALNALNALFRGKSSAHIFIQDIYSARFFY